MSSEYTKKYAFSDDWFARDVPTWKQVFGPLAGRPGLRYLEIGVYEGRSFLWMLENVLTDPSCRLTAIDIFVPPEVGRRFLENVKLSGQAQRVTTIQGYSQVELRKLPLNSMDIVYVDGSHTADDVLADAVLSWGLLKEGGLIAFDDYEWDGSHYTGPGRHLPAELRPGAAIRAFIDAYRSSLDIVSCGYQVFLRKRANPCPNKSTCSPLGEYTYEWTQQRLYRGAGRDPVALTPGEVRSLELIFWNREFDGGFVVSQPVLDDPGVRALTQRLGLQPERPAARRAP